MSTSATPAMAQYLAAKKDHPGALLFFRMGDFYELFFEDAVLASRELGIALTSRSKGEGAIPMAGVPVRSLDNYLGRLVAGGHRVAICEQVQDARKARGVVDRRVVRVITPGTLTEDTLLEDRRPNHLAAVTEHSGRVGIAWVELSTGSFTVNECDAAGLADELSRIDAAEVLVAEEQADLVSSLGRGSVTRRPDHDFGQQTAERALLGFFNTATLEGFGLGDTPLAIRAAGALILYLQETQLAALPHIAKVDVLPRGDFMMLDRATRASLELVETIRGDQGTPLLRILDRCQTSMGGRLLRQWVLSPLTSPAAIGRRQDALAELFEQQGRLRSLRDALAGVQDLQRLTGRISCGRANARDLVALRSSLRRLPDVLGTLQGSVSPALAHIAAHLDPLEDLATAIGSCLVDEPPTTLREGGLIREGHDQELDELLLLSRNSKQWLAAFQTEQAARTGIANLKVGFNKVFGYYIEITNANRHVEVPEGYVRKQTTKNAERYVTDELKAFESKVLRAEETSRDLEYQLFCALRDRIAADTDRLQMTAALVAELDVLAGLATVARERDYHRPEVSDSLALRIEEGRHPVIEATHASGTFVPNDTRLDPPAMQMVLLTGPNMAGKSTYIRQNALIVLMAQMGSFVPARKAHIGVADRIFTRVGAADDISSGASTFMVEMTETANILNNATERSLVILDEVGRGTSTYDGLALAWAIAEDLHDRIGCRTLFATHYHQLTDLADLERGIVNHRVAVREWGDEIVFLHRIEEGGTDKSYGLHVARLAGLPRPLLERAREILDKLEEEGVVVSDALASGHEHTGPRQLNLFSGVQTTGQNSPRRRSR